jgi:hypothetical protein
LQENIVERGVLQPYTSSGSVYFPTTNSDLLVARGGDLLVQAFVG